MGGGCSRAGGVANLVAGVEQSLLFEQGAGHRQQAVGDGAQGAAVTVAALAQRGITAAAERVVLGCQARPMIERVREPLIAGVTAYDDAGFAAAAGHRGSEERNAAVLAVFFNSLPSYLQRLRATGIRWPSLLTSNPLAFFSDRLSDSYSLFTRSAHLLSVP